jgi:hypothetical protein
MPKQIRVAKISTVNGCSIELARIYRKARRGEMDLSDAKGFAWILKTLSSMISDSDLERRLAALEDQLTPGH